MCGTTLSTLHLATNSGLFPSAPFTVVSRFYSGPVSVHSRGGISLCFLWPWHDFRFDAHYTVCTSDLPLIGFWVEFPLLVVKATGAASFFGQWAFFRSASTAGCLPFASNDSRGSRTSRVLFSGRLQVRKQGR